MHCECLFTDKRFFVTAHAMWIVAYKNHRHGVAVIQSGHGGGVSSVGAVCCESRVSYALCVGTLLPRHYFMITLTTN
jgi:hypothetical protein